MSGSLTTPMPFQLTTSLRASSADPESAHDTVESPLLILPAVDPERERATVPVPPLVRGNHPHQIARLDVTPTRPIAVRKAPAAPPAPPAPPASEASAPASLPSTERITARLFAVSAPGARPAAPPPIPPRAAPATRRSGPTQPPTLLPGSGTRATRRGTRPRMEFPAMLAPPRARRARRIRALVAIAALVSAVLLAALAR